MGPDRTCVFCAIMSGGTPALVVFENADVIAFLDHRPLFPGHCLVVPRAHHETLADLPDALRDPFFAVVQILSDAVPRGMQAEGSFVAINNRVSQSVPHLHAHVVPRRRGDGLRGFFWPRQKYAGPEAMREVQQRLRAAVDRLKAGPA